MKILAGIAAAAALLAGGAFAHGLQRTPTPAPAVTGAPVQSAGLCVLLDDKGEVVDARLAQTSGDPSMDQNAVALAKRLQWAPPFPKAGWVGVRITLSDNGPDPAPPGSLPRCSAGADASDASAI